MSIFGNKLKVFLVHIILILGLYSFAQKTDTIIHINGNVLLGEIKKLDNSIVTFKMDGMGTIKFELDKINTFSSNKHFQIVLESGLQYYGTFDTSSVFRMVRINTINNSEVISVEDVIELYPIKRNFWLRTSGLFSLGFNFSKGSGIASLTSSGKLDYRNRKSYTILNWNENTTFQADTIKSSKIDGSLNFQRVIIRKWYFGLNAEGSSNSELGLDLRILAGISINNYIIQNYHNRLYLSLGTSGNREWATGNEAPTNNMEGLLGVQYNYFKYTNPEISISTYLNAYPNITTSGRWRVNYSLDAMVEVINDFHVGFSLYYNYDSKPVSEDASTDDYGINTTLSYSFH